MTHSDPKPFRDIREILDNNKLTAHFQQIVSVSRKTVVGLEGLIRCTDAQTGERVTPGELFEAARATDMLLELDRACRETILREFGRVCADNPEKLLFLNMNLTVLEYASGSGYLFDQIRRHHLNPRNIVIEISELNVPSNDVLKRFVDTYKRYGFVVALDDVGTGLSNMDRILLVRPDIIKIDISLVKNIHLDFYKQGVFKSLVILANKIGALVITEGVELEEEAIQILRLGSHMIQGFHLSVPAAITDERTLFENNKIDLLSKRFNDYIRLQSIQRRNKTKKLFHIVNQCVARLSDRSSDEFDAVLGGIVAESETMECAYILDSAGMQISGTICDGRQSEAHENLIFYSAQNGTDHSMEKYYYPLADRRRKRCQTEPYVSLATGSLCVTISAVFHDKDNDRCIFCADFKTEEDFYNIELGGPVVGPAIPADPDVQGILMTLSEELITDSLTGAYNRRYIEEKLPIDLYNASTEKQPLSVILADIDRFKGINDGHGHLSGDQVLREFVALTRRCIRRQSDWVARYGGDEFLIVLQNADEGVAGRVAETLRAACERNVVRHAGKSMGFTVSLGVYTARQPYLTAGEIIGLADKNLYAAKKQGRNRTFQDSRPVAESPMSVNITTAGD